MSNESFGHLKELYSGVVMAVGAQGNARPGWLSEDGEKRKKDRVVNARDLVYWYNNHPLYENYEVSLKDAKHVAIIGNGNVAIDIARILLREPEELAGTEISMRALQELRRSGVRAVSVVGRRGVTHSAFALKELRELIAQKIRVYAVREEL